MKIMTVRVAINGFGCVGCNILPAIVEYNRKDVTIVAINDVGDVTTAVTLAKQI
jgi:glyceraldehyde 3-phosphate dehydrogenase